MRGFFRRWTKGQMTLGAVLIVVFVAVLMVYTFIADFEYAKSNTYSSMGDAITEEESRQQQLVSQLHAQLDEELIQSSENSPVVEDAQFRDQFETLQTTFIQMMNNEDGNYTEDVKTVFDEQEVNPSSFVSIYVTSPDMSSGHVYFVSDAVDVFSFTYEEEQLTELNHEQTTQFEQVEIVEEEE